MSQTLYFKTSLFDVTREKENPINPIYGVSLLEWLRDSLRGEIDITEPEAEDWGWYSELEYQNQNYLIGSCAYFEEGGDPTQQLEWIFQVDKHRSLKDKLLGRNKMTSKDSCFLFFKDIFDKHPAICDVQVG